MKQPPSEYPRLSSLLKRAHLHTILVAICLAGISLTSTGLFAMRAVAEHNLQLVARSLSYTVEAAVVFHDAQAAHEALQLVASWETLSSARILDHRGQPLADWASPNNAAPGSFQYFINNLIQPSPVQWPIVHNNVTIGQLVLANNGKAMVTFLLKGFMLMAISLALAALVSLYLTNRITRRISKPLSNLTKVAHRVRHERNFEARVPSAQIAELNALSEDFNALLTELQAWHQTQEQEKAELNHQASHDSLTGLANRSLFEAKLKSTQLEALKHNSRFAVLYIDADHFKEINDTLGHAIGDLVLQEIATRLHQQVRSGDTVARLGGDEFAILLPNLTQTRDVSRIAEAITHHMLVPFQLSNDQQIDLSLSIGVAVFPEDANDSNDLLEAADQAMYASKQAGRGHWQRIHTNS